MQDALLIYYLIANFLQAGFCGDPVEALQRAVKAHWCALRAAVAGTGNAAPRAVVGAAHADWMARLTRLEVYVAAAA